MLSFGLLIVLGLSVHLSGFFKPKQEITKGSKASNLKQVKVLVHKVGFTANDKVFEAMGTGKARLSAEIFPAVSDEVTQVVFKSQDLVQKGSLLVQLEDQDEKLGLKLAKVKFQDAKALLDRYQKAVKEGAISQTELDSAKAEHDSALLNIEQAELALQYHKILAPFDGFVGIPNINPGDRVTPNTRITGLDDRKVLYIDFEVPEALAGKITTNQQSHKISATTPAYPTTSFLAHLGALESRIDPNRRTLKARVEIDNSADLLRPGMSFRIRWEISGGIFPTLPEIALQWSRNGSFLWLVRDGKAVKIPVSVVARKESMILVEGDLEAGDMVVIEGLQRLREGLEVAILGIHESAISI